MKRTMAEPAPPVEQNGWRALAPWVGWALGPASWAMHQVLSYAFVPVACETGSYLPLHLLTVVALALAVGGGIASLAVYRRARASEPSRSAGRIRLMAMVGGALCLAAAVGILFEYAGSFALDLCAPA